MTYFLSLTLWSLFTLFHGMAVGLKTLLLCRFGLGISEAPCFPVNSRVVSAWFPQQERAKATAVYTVGEYLGLACFAPLLFWIMDGFRLAGAVRQRWRRRHSVCPGVVALLPRTA
ncbi:4-hydroxyphenylpyruvate dioxygenase [Klebsiella pneumoniae]|nr:4-hydroxyphenylpyruvate dioxygenase [Klebsiella pneumoniae]